MDINSKNSVNETVVEHLPKLRQIVRKISKNEGVADDIVQECCVQIIE